ncbi:MAG: hypothetical protein RL115_1331 [Bacteroidota bacterium]
MQLVKLITSKRINTLAAISSIVLLTPVFTYAQDNSPYSRFGIGDLAPKTHVVNRAMGGISAAYADFISINYNNPASYASFQAFTETKSKKLQSGRAILDIGVNYDNRAIQEPGNATKFASNNIFFSYLQMGVPLKAGWGLTFGLRPISRINYKILSSTRLVNPLPPFNLIDSTQTLYEGTGGTYRANIGTGITVFKKQKFKQEENLSIGVNAGYLFGNRDFSTRRAFVNDTVTYYKANYETRADYGNLYFDAGLQYKKPLSEKLSLTLGVTGAWAQTLNATQDVLRQTFDYNTNGDTLQVDSVYLLANQKGKIELPSNFTVGFVLQKQMTGVKESSWLIGVDFVKENWSKYRYYGQADNLTDKTAIRVGGQFTPAPKKNYFSNVTYRFGFFTGKDYVSTTGSRLKNMGGTFGLALPVGNYGQFSRTQYSVVNLAFEYSKRGGNSNPLKENLFRISAGFSLSDLWFGKRKYD